MISVEISHNYSILLIYRVLLCQKPYDNYKNMRIVKQNIASLIPVHFLKPYCDILRYSLHLLFIRLKSILKNIFVV